MPQFDKARREWYDEIPEVDLMGSQRLIWCPRDVSGTPDQSLGPHQINLWDLIIPFPAGFVKLRHSLTAAIDTDGGAVRGSASGDATFQHHLFMGRREEGEHPGATPLRERRSAKYLRYSPQGDLAPTQVVTGEGKKKINR